MNKNDRADLHIHTCASDGTWTPAELIKEAKYVGLGLIAVTDHDNVSNVAVTADLAKSAGIGFVRGVEVSSTKEGLQFHILAYGVDTKDKNLLDLICTNEQMLLDKDTESIRRLEQQGWPVSVAEYSRYTYDRRRGGFPFLAYLVDKKLCSGIYDFFNRIFTKDNAMTFPVFPSVSEVVDCIHNAGGIAVCAHAASGFHTKDVRQNLKLLGNEKLDGFECYHSGHDEVSTQLLLRYCQTHDLFVTAGSDCHGTFVPGRRLGVPAVRLSDLRLPEKILE